MIVVHKTHKFLASFEPVHFIRNAPGMSSTMSSKIH